MAWEFNNNRIGPQETIYFSYWWNGEVNGKSTPRYNGIHVAQAKPVPAGSGGLRVAFDVDLSIVETVCQQRGVGHSYQVIIKNRSNIGATYTLRIQRVD